MRTTGYVAGDTGCFYSCPSEQELSIVYIKQRTLISSGTVWEQKYGYSRAVRIGDLVVVAGTTAVDERGAVVGADDPYAQARFIFEKIGRALAEAGASLSDVVRVRTFVVDISRWEEVARAQGEVFAEIRPAATLVAVSALVAPELLVEIEVDAITSERPR